MNSTKITKLQITRTTFRLRKALKKTTKPTSIALRSDLGIGLKPPSWTSTARCPSSSRAAIRVSELARVQLKMSLLDSMNRSKPSTRIRPKSGSRPPPAAKLRRISSERIEKVIKSWLSTWPVIERDNGSSKRTARTGLAPHGENSPIPTCQASYLTPIIRSMQSLCSSRVDTWLENPLA